MCENYREKVYWKTEVVFLLLSRFLIIEPSKDDIYDDDDVLIYNNRMKIADVYILLLVIRAVTFVNAYVFECPHRSQWKFRAKALCIQVEKYTCLYDHFNRIYKESCRGPRRMEEGKKFTNSLGFRLGNCSTTRFQPIIFNTTEQTDCLFLKSECSGEGEIIYNNGTSKTDRLCTCDSSRGYEFVMTSHNKSCNPFYEDCSCYRKNIGEEQSTAGKDVDQMENFDKINQTKDVVQVKELDSVGYSLKQGLDMLQVENTDQNTGKPIAKIVLTVLIVGVLIFIGICFKMLLFAEIITTSTMKRKLKDELEARHFLRLMIVGKQSVGKTCLMRRLLRQSIDGVESTDGVDIVTRRCKIDINSGKWTTGKDLSNDHADRLTRLFKGKMNSEEKREQKGAIAREHEEEQNSKPYIVSTGKDLPISIERLSDNETDIQIPESSHTTINPSHPPITIDKDIQREDIDEYSLKKQTPGSNDKKVNIDFKIESLLKLVKTFTSKGQRALCEIWDFAGQNDFYATHFRPHL